MEPVVAAPTVASLLPPEEASTCSEYTCFVCCDVFSATPRLAKRWQCCGADHGNEVICQSCTTQHIKSVVQNTMLGTCPQIGCAHLSHVEAKRKRGLIYRRWSDPAFFPELAGTVAKYKKLAQIVTQYMCSRCHTNTSLLQPSLLATPLKELTAKLVEEGKTEEDAQSMQTKLVNAVYSYVDGDTDVETCYQKVCELFPSFLVENTDTEYVKRNVFFSRRIFQLMDDPERQTTFILRYVRDQRIVLSECCDVPHCFRCRARNHSDSCTDYLAQLWKEVEVLPCPNCNVSLTKTDGCDTLSCVCGTHFSWRERRERIEGCREFLQLFPEDTDQHSLRLAFLKPSQFDHQNPLQHWLGNHLQVLLPQLKRRFQADFGLRYSQDQLCALLRNNNNVFNVEIPQGVQIVLRVLSRAQDTVVGQLCKQVSRQERSIHQARRSLLFTLYRNTEERQLVASDPSGKQLLPYDGLPESLSAYVRGCSRLDWTGYSERVLHNSCQQFLQWVYGTYPFFRFQPGIVPTYITKWDEALSNDELLVRPTSPEDPIVSLRRGVDAGPVPAGMHVLTSSYCALEVELVEAPLKGNTITFGLSLGPMRKNNDEAGGVGVRKMTWGLYNERYDEYARTHATESLVGSVSVRMPVSFRGLRAGDRLRAVAALDEGRLVLSVNDTDFIHEFAVPSAGKHFQEFYFAATLSTGTVMQIVQPTAEQQAAQMAGIAVAAHPVTGYNRFFNPKHGTRYLAARSSLRKNVVLLKRYFQEEETLLPEESFRFAWKSKDGRNSFLDKCAAAKVDPLAVMEAMAPRLCVALDYAEDALQQVLQKHQTEVSRRTTAEAAVAEATADNLEQLIDRFTWCDMYAAVEYVHSLAKEVREAAKREKANEFYAKHGADACFVSAQLLVQYYSMVRNRIPLPEEERNALHFQHCFAAEMQQWYDEDLASSDPLFPPLSSQYNKCRCLPRHLSCDCPIKR